MKKILHGLKSYFMAFGCILFDIVLFLFCLFNIVLEIHAANLHLSFWECFGFTLGILYGLQIVILLIGFGATGLFMLLGRVLLFFVNLFKNKNLDNKGKSLMMTKGEYCKLKGLRVYNPVFDLDSELDDDFKCSVDILVSNCEEISNGKDNCDI